MMLVALTWTNHADVGHADWDSTIYVDPDQVVGIDKFNYAAARDHRGRIAAFGRWVTRIHLKTGTIIECGLTTEQVAEKLDLVIRVMA